MMALHKLRTVFRRFFLVIFDSEQLKSKSSVLYSLMPLYISLAIGDFYFILYSRFTSFLHSLFRPTEKRNYREFQEYLLQYISMNAKFYIYIRIFRFSSNISLQINHKY